MRTITIIDSELVIDSHCHDYFDFTNEQIFDAVDRAKEGFITLSASKAPTVLGFIGMEWYGFVVTKDNVVLTILPKHEYDRNATNRNSIKSVSATVAHA